MNKEEKEAIQYWKKMMGICMENANICDENDFDEEATHLRKEQIMIETVLNLIKKQQAEIEKKDKIIDLMAEHIAITGWANCPNEDCGANLDCENRCRNDEDIYVECWKMYFEREIEK